MTRPRDRALQAFGIWFFINAVLVGLLAALVQAALGQELPAPPDKLGTTALSIPLARTGGSKSASGAPDQVNSKRSSARSGAARLHLARVCKLEAERSLPDCRELYHIGVRHAGDRWMNWMLAYSKLYDTVARTSRRAKRIRSAPWGDFLQQDYRGENAAWRALRMYSVELIAGKHKSRCPKALHWAGTMDVLKGRMIPASCAAQGQTKNTLVILGPRLGES